MARPGVSSASLLLRRRRASDVGCAPEAPEPWESALEATEFSAACPQLGSTTSPEPSEDEDCLYLNVWTPESRARSASLPVMIWFHGGSNVTGSTADDIPFLQPPTLFYNGRGLVEGPTWWS